MGTPRVVIIGAGFGGLECAKKLDGKPVDVLLIDRHNYHVFSPLLYQVASSLLNPSDIAYPVRKVFRGSANVRFKQLEVQHIDFDRNLLEVDHGPPISWDHLVIATGSTTQFFGNDSVASRALGLKTLGEALQLRNHILSCLEAAARSSDADEQSAWMSFVIVGGGPTGVEYAGALAELMRLVVTREYPLITVAPRIVIVEGRDQLLGAFSDKLGSYASQRLSKLGVEVVLGQLVKAVDGDDVVLDGGDRIRCKTLVWSAGVKAEALSTIDDMPVTERRRIDVDRHLRIDGHHDAFAIGDIAGDLPMLSAPAMQQGRYVADFIMAHLDDEPAAPAGMPPFEYTDKGTMATIGRNAAVCAVARFELTGLLGWLGWLLVHIYYLIGFRNRLVVLGSWCWNYIWYDRPVRIIMRAKRQPTPQLPHSEM